MRISRYCRARSRAAWSRRRFNDMLRDRRRPQHVFPACGAVNARGRMKTIFLDCNDQLAPVWARVIRADDPPIDVNREPFARDELPLVIAGYDIAIDDHSYMPTELVDALQAAQAHRVPRHRPGKLHERRGDHRARHQGAHHQGLWRHRGRRAQHRVDGGRRARRSAHGPRDPRRRLDAARGRAAHRQDAGRDRPRRHRPRGRAHGQGYGHGGHRL